MEALPLRVVLTGSECTGKTTLARELAEHYQTVWVPEYAREYLDRKRVPLDAEDVDEVARGTMAAADAALAEAKSLLFLDTDLVSTIVYSRHYYGECPAWIEREARVRLGHLYLLLHPDVPWVPDGLQRDRPDRREAIHRLFRQMLDELGARFVDVNGPWAARWEAALGAVGRLLAD